jgi:hypothetical protein
MLFVALVTARFVHKLLPETMGQGMGVHCGDCRGKSTRTLLLLLHHDHYLIAICLCRTVNFDSDTNTNTYKRNTIIKVYI